MDITFDFGKFTVHGQFLLDTDLQQSLTPDDAEACGRRLADALAPTLARLFEEGSRSRIPAAIEVLCSGRIRRHFPSPTLSCDLVQLSSMSPFGRHEIEAGAT